VQLAAKFGTFSVEIEKKPKQKQHNRPEKWKSKTNLNVRSNNEGQAMMTFFLHRTPILQKKKQPKQKFRCAFLCFVFQSNSLSWVNWASSFLIASISGQFFFSYPALWGIFSLPYITKRYFLIFYNIVLLN